jgi:hypothetical protein
MLREGVFGTSSSDDPGDDPGQSKRVNQNRGVEDPTGIYREPRVLIDILGRNLAF